MGVFFLFILKRRSGRRGDKDPPSSLKERLWRTRKDKDERRKRVGACCLVGTFHEADGLAFADGFVAADDDVLAGFEAGEDFNVVGECFA